jgi:hypothetical protein
MDGLELLARAYHWPPSVGRDFEVDEWRVWVDRAARLVTQRRG